MTNRPANYGVIYEDHYDIGPSENYGRVDPGGRVPFERLETFEEKQALEEWIRRNARGYKRPFRAFELKELTVSVDTVVKLV